MSSKIGSAYVVYEDLTGRGYIRLDFDKAAFEWLSNATRVETKRNKK